MTKSLIDTLNLPDFDARTEQKDDIDPNAAFIGDNISNAEAALAMVDGRDHADSMDQIYKEVLEHAGSIMDLGWNVDHPRAARVFEVAAAFYKTAIDAKNSKRDAQFKEMKLALEQKKLEMAKTGNGPIIENDPSLIVEDRNELIRQILDQRKNTNGSA